jgi:hypothetical protein
MEASQVYTLVSITVLLLVAILAFFAKKNKKDGKITLLAGIALAFVLAGIIFGDVGLIGYSLLGIGVILAIIDGIKKDKEIITSTKDF